MEEYIPRLPLPVRGRILFYLGYYVPEYMMKIVQEEFFPEVDLAYLNYAVQTRLGEYGFEMSDNWSTNYHFEIILRSTYLY